MADDHKHGAGGSRGSRPRPINHGAQKTWELTLNNPTEEDKKQWIKILTKEDCVNKCIVGEEVGEEKKTPHFQGRVTWKASKRLNAIKKLLGSRVHLEPSKGSPHDWSYYRKGDVFIDVDFKQQGKRSDLLDVAAAVKEGVSMRQIAIDHSVAYIKFHGGIEKLATKVAPPKTPRRMWELEDFHANYQDGVPIFDRKSVILYGPTGTGKTSWAIASFKCPLMCRHVDDLKQFQEGIHDGIIFDDMSFTHLPREANIHLVDYEHGSSIHARYANAELPTGVPRIFTTNVDRGACVLIDDPAVRRRVNILHIGENLVTGEVVEKLTIAQKNDMYSKNESCFHELIDSDEEQE